MSKILQRYPLARRYLYPVRPTPQDVADFWDYMCARHGVKVIDKNDSELMAQVSELLNLMGILNKHEFLKHYTTTVILRPYRGIYIPFTIGVPNEDYDLWPQMRICVHEIDHIIQADLAGDLGFGWYYLTNSAARAHYEAGGLRADMEMEWRYQGRLLDPSGMATKVLHYNCSQLECETTETELRQCIPIIKSDALIEPASREAVIWLDERYGRAA
jgi:hypothetical protein